MCSAMYITGKLIYLFCFLDIFLMDKLVKGFFPEPLLPAGIIS